jgi:hypothetical protein
MSTITPMKRFIDLVEGITIIPSDYISALSNDDYNMIDTYVNVFKTNRDKVNTEVFARMQPMYDNSKRLTEWLKLNPTVMIDTFELNLGTILDYISLVTNAINSYISDNRITQIPDVIYNITVRDGIYKLHIAEILSDIVDKRSDTYTYLQKCIGDLNARYDISKIYPPISARSMINTLRSVTGISIPINDEYVSKIDKALSNVTSSDAMKTIQGNTGGSIFNMIGKILDTAGDKERFNSIVGKVTEALTNK